MRTRWAQWISPSAVGISVAIGLVIGSIGLGYVWQRERNARLEREIQSLRTQVENLRKENQALLAQLAQLKAPDRIRRFVQERIPGLSEPGEEQILWIPEGEGQVAGRPPRTGWGQGIRKSGSSWVKAEKVP